MNRDFRGIGRLIKKNNKLIRNTDNPNVSACIIADYAKMGGRDNQYISEKVKPQRIGYVSSKCRQFFSFFENIL